MSQASFDDEELFTEATADIQSEIEESLTAATTALPSHADIVEHDAETVVAALELVEETIDPDTAEAAVADVKKTFLLGQRADAFDSEYATETETTISELEETVATLEAIASASEELREALAGYSVDVQSASAAASSDEESEEPVESTADDAASDEADEEAQESAADEQLEVTDTSGDS
ncbi:DUF5790 family protein [Halonotius pteroides]|uniref:Uncharacterized protein n=1 Tax=Halonotius pteroides TaxID=268735 RepID=A0A3A6QBE6_9EURY|nr:DUF5790 family protein [Halonotius pteroides]RJX48001.1 hypothetical protein DP106_13360 [Halonotius pteroides]